jgi:hypothetical protein
MVGRGRVAGPLLRAVRYDAERKRGVVALDDEAEERERAMRSRRPRSRACPRHLVAAKRLPRSGYRIFRGSSAMTDV